ncbi:hypothetical protein BDW02DRAFT_624851 [Decorospora gaudefroyi]|uniref:Uncharacterized protein n=1 Tax=Decorospora gaudefroyi TaxID=184978 RepID=A0A6A5K8V6_9PLEO|nr:hypothetical protein BDW02DRAFT_624851 [Decorospora gaudefroyi]
MSRPPQRPIKRLLIANRGEIAARIISSARELDIETYAVYITGDDSHAIRAAHAIKLPSASTFMSIDSLIEVIKQHEIDAVHPGYGFLSESPAFSERAWNEAGAVVIGPGWGILSSTGDKLKARLLAEECNVPVCPALLQPTNRVEEIQHFASKVDYPIMVKAVDGGGGRGIRLIRNEDQLASSVKRAVEESPSKQVFAEKAAVDGFRHIEVQIIGDGNGNVTHLWERECSIQRRYQKVIEVAPSLVSDRDLIRRVIEDAVKMARQISYFSLGTFEFLVNPQTKSYFFLEINPRLQVEHTITEAICMTDIVKAQLLLAQGATLDACALPNNANSPQPPPAHSIQLRITAENPETDWSLSIGKITSFQFPSGNGIRVDTHLVSQRPATITTDFDSLIAKIVVTASSWEDSVQKARRALEDTHISGIKTNMAILKAIVTHADFLNAECDTQWLETNHQALVHQTQNLASSATNTLIPDSTRTPSTAVSAANTLFRKGDAWTLSLTPTSTSPPKNSHSQSSNHHIQLTRVIRNDFPHSVSADILFSTSPSPSTPNPTSIPYTATLTATSATASATTSHHRQANPSDPTHISIPFAGQIVEICVDAGDSVQQGDVLIVVRQMKMEIEIRSPRTGRVGWVFEGEEGEDVDMGTLGAVVEGEGGREGGSRL